MKEHYKELNDFYQILENNIYINNGIIYDEYVCDRLLSDHFTNLYKNKNKDEDENDNEKFYDINYDVETRERIIISNKIKISFNNNNNYIKFIEFFNENSNLIEKLNLIIEITISKDEPPYKNNNYISYGLLLKGKNNYYYSKNTGTPYDLMNNVENKIIKQIINKETQYIRGFYSNYDILLDINRMIENGWKITNLPFNYYKKINYNNNCPICLEYLNYNYYHNYHNYHNTNNQIINLFNYNIHHKCLFNYLLTQKNALIFKCPYRNTIDLNSCKYNIDYRI